jgi:hypothetical protein
VGGFSIISGHIHSTSENTWAVLLSGNKFVMDYCQKLERLLYHLASSVSHALLKICQVILSLNNAEAMTKNTHFQPTVTASYHFQL